MSKPRQIRITHIHKKDVYYKDRDKIIGLEGEFIPNKQHWDKGYYVGYFNANNGERYFFVGVRYIKI